MPLACKSRKNRRFGFPSALRVGSMIRPLSGWLVMSCRLSISFSLVLSVLLRRSRYPLLRSSASAPRTIWGKI
ncbi:hypothetical protein D1872_315320 [compost metagenome]